MNEQGLKALENLGAELGAAKAENEAMRILLRESYSELLVMKTEVGFRGKTLELIDRIDAFLSQQPEPTDTYTAVDMATAAAQVEQQPAGDGAPPCWWIDHGSHGQITQRQDEAGKALAEGKRVVRYTAAPIAQTRPAEWHRVVERLIANVEILDQRPRPICRDCADCNGVCDSGLDCDIRALVEEARAMLAAPIAQTAPQVPERLPVEPYQTVDRSSTNYKAGWNACRKAMLEGQTVPQPEQSGLPSASAKWAKYDTSWVVDYLRDETNFDADAVGEMLEFARRAALSTQGTNP